MSNQPVIVSAKRTPIGKFFGGLSKVPAPVLGSYAIGAVLSEVPAIKGHVDEVLMGSVLQAGLGQNPARQAALKAGLPDTMSAMTINKVCGSGLEAVMRAAAAIKAGDAECIIAGGMENMTAAPHFAKVREGVKFGTAPMEDHMAYDGLRCPFEGWAMTMGADHTAKKNEISRAEQDRFSVQSHQRATEAAKQGWFKSEIVALTGEQCLDKKSPGVSADEGVRPETTMDSVAKLRPIPGHEFITAANASQISDGAAAVAVMSLSKAEKLGIKPIAKIVGHSTHAHQPNLFATAPVGAMQKLLTKTGWSVADVDLWEINEAFAVVTMAAIHDLKLDHAKVNIHGGACALGHPIGASGARIIVTLLGALKKTGGKRGIASLCIGGGEATALAVEML